MAGENHILNWGSGFFFVFFLLTPGNSSSEGKKTRLCSDAGASRAEVISSVCTRWAGLLAENLLFRFFFPQLCTLVRQLITKRRKVFSTIIAIPYSLRLWRINIYKPLLLEIKSLAMMTVYKVKRINVLLLVFAVKLSHCVKSTMSIVVYFGIFICTSLVERRLALSVQSTWFSHMASC